MKKAASTAAQKAVSPPPGKPPTTAPNKAGQSAAPAPASREPLQKPTVTVTYPEAPAAEPSQRGRVAMVAGMSLLPGVLSEPPGSGLAAG